MHKNAFTLIETVIVLSIVAVIFLILSPNFKPTNQNNNEQLCIQNIHQFIDKEIQIALQSTSTTTSWTSITIDPWEQYIDIQDMWSWQRIEFPEGINFFPACRSIIADIQLSWDRQTIEIYNKTIQPFDENTFIGQMEFVQCEWICTSLGKITIDTRIDRTDLHLCSYSWSICHYE